MGGPSGGSGPTLQQQQLQTAQALTTANLNLQENAQRKSILNSMLGTRVFRGSALSRAIRGDTPGGPTQENAPPASASQNNNGEFGLPITGPNTSLVDSRESGVTGGASTPAGGAGASGGGGAPAGGIRGGGSGRAVAKA